MFAFLAPYATAIKWGAIAITVLAVISIGSFAVNSWYTTVQENAVLKLQQRQLEQTIDEKNKIIKLNEDLVKLRDQIILERDTEIGHLERRLDTITDNLPENPNDVVPESTRELIRRLSGQ